MTTPGEISGAEFRRTLRGYDPEEVHAFLVQVAARMEALERQSAAALSRLAEYGEGDRGDQIDQLTEDINRILHAAQAAAENLRTRTEAEVTELRTRAERAVQEMLAAAEADAYALRKDAWEAGTKLLEDVAEYVAATRKHADAEALEIIGESERTAHRKLATARRDAENHLRAARLEGERIRVEAQAERDEVLENAHRAAEGAQERARALERRRDELLADIERLQLEGTPNMTVEPASTTVRVVRPGDPAQPDSAGTDDSVRIVKPSTPTSWADGTENVRLVEPPAKEPVEFLDGDTIADEVRKLRDTEEIEAVAPSGAAGFGEAPATPSGTPADPEPDLDQAEGSGAGGDVGTAPPGEDAPIPPQPLATQPGSHEAALPSAERQEAESAPLDQVQPEPGGKADHEDEPASEAREVPEPRPEEPAGTAPTPTEPGMLDDLQSTSEIDQLFSQLRGGTVTGPPRRPQVAIVSSGSGITPESMGTEVSEDTPIDELVPPPPVDPADVRDRLLLPITNRVLRGIKRQLSEAQNIALEGLRLDPEGWTPDPAAFEREVAADIGLLQSEAFAAGGTAAGELLGDPPPRAKFPGVDAGIATDFTNRIHADLAEALAAGRAAGQGARELSSTVSRVFRAWRTDQAEREIRALATHVFHRGMQASYAGAGVEKLRLVISGAGCVDCRSAAEHLVDTADGESALPPLHPECTCTLVHT